MPNCLSVRARSVASAVAGGENLEKETCLPACLSTYREERGRKAFDLMRHYFSTVAKKKELILIWRW
jgi:hypothetical protein